MYPTYPKSGFTLIELSIVLVIIGLIIGGVLAGRDLIKSATIRSQIAQIEAFRTAVNTFRGKYNCLPGDCANATDFFGTVTGGCYGNASTNGLTCNGTGNGFLGGNSAAVSLYAYEENYHFWVQLSAAGLITGSYTGITANGNRASRPNWNVPASKYGMGGVDADYFGYVSSAGYYPANYGHLFLVGATLSNWNDMMRRPLFSPEDAFALDTKADDGFPGKGAIRSYTPAFGYTPDCATSTTAATATYNVTYTDTACVILWLNAF